MIRDLSAEHARDHMRKEFVTAIGHELRNAVTPVRAQAQRMQRRAEYDAETASRIIDEVDRLCRLIDDLVDSSLADSNDLELRIRDADVVQIARSCIDDVVAVAPDHRIEALLPDAPVRGRWDPDRLEQILANLLLNGVRHTPSGTVVTVLIEPRDVGVLIRVSDTGPGIPLAALPTLFARDPGRPRSRTGGLGLGLYLTRRLVEAHGGHIRAFSYPGLGSTIDVWLPLGLMLSPTQAPHRTAPSPRVG